MGLDDFRTVKVIGKGAFGEASVTMYQCCSLAGRCLFEMVGRFDWFRKLIQERSML